ncbi:MAG: hypothetical protein CO001_02735 [Candidatus Portnoybacteria bacterium CG_4_8_14_3_um_filter_40_10]|uniref:Uncharacterized protein n=4 Tax=Candidatus Portnoyibacteriota TaxID=1817913 RepID=A0A2M7II54_9BACT|nr:MAG: hypothetical protein CO001_02735 [Candidatus Portnoybacteria bacterium CG_4_8_14_3_um_filter_40_10]PIY74540.1 MAG: hypothetical protein COY85_02975 [Candidatus Portnoybacteria bacterium CG_4_10_14_0_8_um_filter_40_50]
MIDYLVFCSLKTLSLKGGEMASHRQCKMRGNRMTEIEILKHKKTILEIELNKARRLRDECKREKDKWRQAGQNLAKLVLKRKNVSWLLRQAIKNFPDS